MVLFVLYKVDMKIQRARAVLLVPRGSTRHLAGRSCHTECQTLPPGETVTVSASDVSCSQMHSVATFHQRLETKAPASKSDKDDGSSVSEVQS